MISPSSHRELLVDLGDPPRISLPPGPRIEAARARQIARQEQPLSLEAELAQTRALRLRCEALLGELGCPVGEVDQDLQRGAA